MCVCVYFILISVPQQDRSVYCEDWGEGLTNKSVPVMCVVNLQSGAVTVLQGVPQDVSPGQVRVSEATSTVVDIHSRWC